MKEKVRGTFGFIAENDRRWTEVTGEKTRNNPYLVIHAFANGRLLLLDGCCQPEVYVIADAEDFTPSREAYFSFGSYVEPEWDGDTARCTNFWCDGYIFSNGTECYAGSGFTDERVKAYAAEHGLTFCFRDNNRPENVHTDEEALRIYGFAAAV
jgi:hypothetical protein